MQIQKITTGILGTNTFIVESDETSIIIDPADCPQGLVKYLEENIKPSAILLTHGHFDHISGARALSEHFDIPIYINVEDYEMLESGIKNGSYLLLGRDIVIGSTQSVRTIQGESELHIRDMIIKAYPTPGHSKGSVSYLIENHLFSGDLVFEGSYGRTDLHGGDFATIISSIKSLRNLPEDTLIYPGHGNCRFTIADYFGSFSK